MAFRQSIEAVPHPSLREALKAKRTMSALRSGEADGRFGTPSVVAVATVSGFPTCRLKGGANGSVTDEQFSI